MCVVTRCYISSVLGVRDTLFSLLLDLIDKEDGRLCILNVWWIIFNEVTEQNRFRTNHITFLILIQLIIVTGEFNVLGLLLRTLIMILDSGLSALTRAGLFTCLHPVSIGIDSNSTVKMFHTQ